MVNLNEQRLNQIFSALSDPTRRSMVERLSKESMSIAELSRPFDMTKSAITKHVKILENAGLLIRTIEGRTHHCRLDTAPLEQATEWMRFYESFWSDKFDQLETFLNEGEQT